jgi:DNA polymerase-3 subunit epsilon
MLNDEFRAMLARGNFVVLDTETTGLDRPAHICEIAVLDMHGRPLLDTLVCIKGTMPPAAQAAHGIDDDMLIGAPCWMEVQPRVVDAIYGKDVITYNAQFDRRMLHLTDEAHNLPRVDYKAFSTWHCAMEWYAELHGEINEYYGSYRWQKLVNAIAQSGLAPFTAHRAMDDCEATLRLIAHHTSDMPIWTYDN